MCATTDGKQRITRLQNKVSFIDQALGGTNSDDCQLINIVGWRYAKCFD
jgi:hypothetical protein